MAVNSEIEDESSWIWLTSEQLQMGFPLRPEFANENQGEAGSSKQLWRNEQRTDQTACFLAPIIIDFIRNTKRQVYDEKFGHALEILDIRMEQRRRQQNTVRATGWTPVHFTEDMRSTRMVQNGWNGGCNGKRLPRLSRWPLMIHFFYRNEKSP